MAGGQDGRKRRRQDGRRAEWQEGRMAGGQDSRVAGGRRAGRAGWLEGKEVRIAELLPPCCEFHQYPGLLLHSPLVAEFKVLRSEISTGFPLPILFSLKNINMFYQKSNNRKSSFFILHH